MCAVIINNMSKLVEDPEDAAPFLPKLMPALDKAKEEVSDPEARTVCGKAFEQLQSIDARLKTHKSVKAVRDVVAKEVKASAGVPAETAEYVTTLVCSLINCKVDDDGDWVEELKAYKVSEAAAIAMYKAMAKLYFTEQDESDEEDDVEQLCDCRFTLAYGSKVLLHNTKLKLKRGYKYGLLGGNDSGKTTLMRSIANEQVDGFRLPPSSAPSLSRLTLSASSPTFLASTTSSRILASRRRVSPPRLSTACLCLSASASSPTRARPWSPTSPVAGA